MKTRIALIWCYLTGDERAGERYTVPVPTSPLLQFPCDYPIKVMARTVPGLRGVLDEILRRHAGAAALERVTERPSRQSNYVGVTYVIQAHSEAQISALFADLKTCADVLMVL